MHGHGDGLRIVGAAKRFGSVQAVDGVDLHVPQGSLIGFIGPNGAGKTTLMRAVLGMVRLDRGDITWNGSPIGERTRNQIGYMPQERGLYARMKVLEQVVYFGRLAGLARREALDRAAFWLARVGLAERHDSLVQDLSGGNQQRVQLAVSLVHDPALLVLDEPFAGLDPLAADTMREIIAERAEAGASVLFSSHQLGLVEDLCEHVVVIDAGREVASGSITDLRAASPVRRLRVRWIDPVDQWEPLTGVTVAFDGRCAVVDLDRDDDFGASIAHAVAAAPVSEIGIEPPALEELFAELVKTR